MQRKSSREEINTLQVSQMKVKSHFWQCAPAEETWIAQLSSLDSSRVMTGRREHKDFD